MPSYPLTTQIVYHTHFDPVKRKLGSFLRKLRDGDHDLWGGIARQSCPVGSEDIPGRGERPFSSATPELLLFVSEGITLVFESGQACPREGLRDMWAKQDLNL